MTGADLLKAVFVLTSASGPRPSSQHSTRLIFNLRKAKAIKAAMQNRRVVFFLFFAR